MRRIAMIGLAALGAAASAQDVGKFSQTPRFVPQAVVGNAMGRCLVSRDRGDAMAVALAWPGEPGFDKKAGKIKPDMVACLKGRGSATLKMLDVQGGIAEALLGERDGALIDRAAALAPVAPARVATSADHPVTRELIGCAVAADPASAAALLRAPAGSPEEMTGFRALSSALQNCAPVTGEVSLKPFQIRPLVAVSVYRLVSAGA